MSDIKIEFTGTEIALMVLIVGWPGLLLGAVGGALLWRRHRVIGALLGAAVGLTVWVGAKILMR